MFAYLWFIYWNALGSLWSMDQERRSQRSNLPRSATCPARSPGCGKSGTWSFSEVCLFLLFKEMHAMSFSRYKHKNQSTQFPFFSIHCFMSVLVVLESRSWLIDLFFRVFVGTVSEFCVKHAECPVITIKRRADETPEDPVDDWTDHYLNIFHPVDKLWTENVSWGRY